MCEPQKKFFLQTAIEPKLSSNHQAFPLILCYNGITITLSGNGELMNKFTILSVVLEYIEENLTQNVTPELCAQKCGYSLSNLQKLFRCVFHIGVGDYIARRKLSAAARELLESNATVLDTALKYGYQSHEVFTRAFRRLWGVSPSEYRKSRRFAEIFPKFGEAVQIMDREGNVMMYSKKKFDVSHLYDFIKEHAGKYVVCFDMVRLMEVNDTYGSAAGDIGIAECLRRIDMESDETMLPIRIGGDEFVLITEFDQKEDAEAIARKILSHNGGTVTSGKHTFPVSMRAGFVVIPTKNLRYNDLFTQCVLAGHDMEA